MPFMIVVATMVRRLQPSRSGTRHLMQAGTGTRQIGFTVTPTAGVGGERPMACSMADHGLCASASGREVEYSSGARRLAASPAPPRVAAR
jgi:hypothetical protein